MKPENDNRLTRLFLEATRREPSEREAFLSEACAGDSRLLAELRSLLDHDENLPEILKTGELAGGFTGAADLEPNTEVGNYRLVEKLGEGGMGLVYRAEQLRPLQRQVALKLIRPGLATGQVLARFESERQVLALMNHPNISRVLDAGTTEQGQPYFAMEYVDGQPITQFCDRRRLSLERRLDLFLQVCKAVQHAHRNAIIHRDLKPSNVLVTVEDGEPVPKIIDFGIAKAMDRRVTRRPLTTESGQFLGTPEYMSPEQAGSETGRVDTRADVYSLGVLLYELLTGTHPFDAERLRAASLEEVRRIIREEDPPKPSVRFKDPAGPSTAARNRDSDPASLCKWLRGDLDSIVLQALAKNPDHRYGSPDELADDLGRYRNHEPVVASSPRAAYRVGKFLKKHRVGVGFAAATVVFLLGITVTSMIQARRVAEQAELARLAADRANEQAATAEQVSEFLVEMFETSSRQTPRAVTVSAREILHNSIEKMEGRLEDQPLLKARMLHAVGRVYARVRAFELARPLLEEAQRRLDGLLGPDHPTTLASRNDLAKLYLDVRLFDAAEEHYLETLRRRQRVLGENHVDTLRSRNDLAFLYKESGRYGEAGELLREALAGMGPVLGEDHPETLIAAGFLVGVYLEEGRYEDAAKMLRDLVVRMRGVLGEEHFETSVAYHNLGCALANLDDRRGALVYLRRAVEGGFMFPGGLLADTHLRPLHGDPEFETLARQARMNDTEERRQAWIRAEVYRARGSFDEAEAIWLDLIDALRRAAGPEDLSTFDAMYRLADLYVAEDRFEDADQLLAELLSLQRRTLGDRHETVAATLWLQSQNAFARGETAQAAELFEQARAIYDLYLPEHGWGASYVQAIASGLRGDRREALRQLALAVDSGLPDSEMIAEERSLAALHSDPEFERLVAEVKRRFGT